MTFILHISLFVRLVTGAFLQWVLAIPVKPCYLFASSYALNMQPMITVEVVYKVSVLNLKGQCFIGVTLINYSFTLPPILFIFKIMTSQYKVISVSINSAEFGFGHRLWSHQIELHVTTQRINILHCERKCNSFSIWYVEFVCLMSAYKHNTPCLYL